MTGSEAIGICNSLLEKTLLESDGLLRVTDKRIDLFPKQLVHGSISRRRAGKIGHEIRVALICSARASVRTAIYELPMK
jgi:hypothetical protein